MHWNERGFAADLVAANVPYRTLSNGAKIPKIGLGTFGSDHVLHETVAEAIRFGASIGYRHFDCASVYDNEDRIGHVFSQLFAHALRRDEVWITSKLWNDKHGEDAVIAGVDT
jgi:alcohol dehydrogenase (NADP+)